MTYEKAVKTLIDAGLLDKTNVTAAVAALDLPAVEFTYPAWAEALARAGLIDKSDVEAAANAMLNAADQEAKDDPDAFDDALENAGIL